MISLIHNKKAQIPSTIVWIAGTFLILLIMILYLVFGGITYLDQGQSKMILSKTSEKSSRESIADSMIIFLETKASNGEAIYDLISKADLSKKDETRQLLFKEKASVFIDTNFFAEGAESKYYRAWIRVYNFTEEISQYYGGYYEYMNNLRGGSGGIDCDPFEEESMVMSIPITSDKKIVLCANLY